MKRLLIMFVVLLTSIFYTYAEVEHSYEISLHYKNGGLSSDHTKIILSTEARENSAGRYFAEAKTAGNETVSIAEFGIATQLFYDIINPETGKIEGGGVRELNETDVIFYMPYSEKAKEIIIYDENLTEKLRIDVSYYSKKEFFEKNITEEISMASPGTAKPAEKLKETRWIYLVLFLAIIIFTIIMIIIRKKTKK